MFNYWLYSIISIIFSWILYKITEEYKYSMVFYSFTLLIILIYYLIEIVIEYYIDKKYSKYLSSVKCKLNQCKYINQEHKRCNETECHKEIISSICKKNCPLDYQNQLCENIYNCDNHYLCKEINNKCVTKGTKCEVLINSEIDNIKSNKKEELNKILNKLNKIGIRKNTLDNYLGINIFLIVIFFLLFLIYLKYNNKIIIKLNYINSNKIKNYLSL